MRTLLLIVTAAATAVAPLSAAAQHWPAEAPPGVAMAEQHRREMERLRAEADRQAAFAARQQLETQLALIRLEAARQTRPITAPVAPPGPGWVRPQDAPPRVTAPTAQIDAWLDRAPRR